MRIELSAIGRHADDKTLLAEIFGDHAAQIRFVVDEDHASRICHWAVPQPQGLPETSTPSVALGKAP
jgi:hypothetical protein